MGHVDYNGPTQVANKITRLFGDSKEVQLLDIAAGSGLVGVEVGTVVANWPWYNR